MIRLQDFKRECKCGASSGRYVGSLDAEISGPAIPLGFDNMSLVFAIHNRPDSGMGSRFEAFVIQRECASITEVK